MSRLKHGHTVGRPSKEYKSWIAMKSRIFNPNEENFHLYGKRGIMICQRWVNSFENFLDDMGFRPKGTSLERINNNGNYEPSNCKWATQKEQCRNLRTNRVITFKGKTMIATDWASYLGMNSKTFFGRLRTLSVKDAITTPIATQFSRANP